MAHFYLLIENKVDIFRIVIYSPQKLPTVQQKTHHAKGKEDFRIKSSTLYTLQTLKLLHRQTQSYFRKAKKSYIMALNNAMEPSTVVIDNGTGYTKMGYAGNMEPSYLIPSVIATSFDKVSQ